MPNRNGMGPSGGGPETGRALGFCITDGKDIVGNKMELNFGPGKNRFFGRGGGRGRSGGRGRGRAMFGQDAVYSLEEQKKHLELLLASVNERLAKKEETTE